LIRGWVGIASRISHLQAACSVILSRLVALVEFARQVTANGLPSCLIQRFAQARAKSFLSHVACIPKCSQHGADSRS